MLEQNGLENFNVFQFLGLAFKGPRVIFSPRL